MLNWLKKGAYRSLTDVLQAIRREIVSLQPKDTSSIKWTKGATGMEAHIISSEPAESVSSPNLLDDVMREDDTVKGHFQVVEVTDPETGDDYIAVVNNLEKNDGWVFSPSICRVRYISIINSNSTNWSSSEFFEVKSVKKLVSELRGQGKKNIYLAMTYMTEPVVWFGEYIEKSNTDYIMIGSVEVTKRGVVYIAQNYQGADLTYDSYQYANRFKLIDTSYYEYPPEPEEGEESQEPIFHQQVEILSRYGLCYIVNKYHRFTDNYTINVNNGDMVYLHVTLGESVTYEFESSDTLPQSKGQNLYYLIGEIDENGLINQRHLTGDITMKWYIVCP